MLSLPTNTKQMCTFLSSTAIVCEGNSLEITCNAGRIIDVISANFGRRDRQTCIHAAMSNINCRASNSLVKVQETCQNKTSCTLRANNVFFGGDPCGGTFKYLLVEYMCDN